MKRSFYGRLYKVGLFVAITPLKTRHFCALLAALLLNTTAESSQVVDSIDSFSKAFSSLAPGVVIEVADGTYTTKGGIKIAGKKGTVEQPIVLKAQHRGKAVIAGAAGSAVCADLGARKIRDEIDAMEVLGIDPLQRLVVPRVRLTRRPCDQ